MTPYLNVRCDYFDHPKTKRLIGLLGRGAEVLPIRLWAYCGMYHSKDGRLTGYAEQEIESLVNWWGKPGEMLAALEKVGYVQRENGAGWAMADWGEHQGHIEALKVRGRRMAEARWTRIRGEDDSNADSIAQAMPVQCSILPSIHPTIQHTLKAGGGEVDKVRDATGKATEMATEMAGPYPMPRSGGLPAPLYPKTATQMVDQCKKEIASIRARCGKQKKIEVVGGERRHTGWTYEAAAVVAMEAWKGRIEEIERATT